MKPSEFLLALAGTGTILLGLGGTARAQRWKACSARVQKDRQDLDPAIDTDTTAGKHSTSALSCHVIQ